MSTPSKAGVTALAHANPEPTERELPGDTLAAAQRGERWARRALVHTYQGRVHALVWRLLAGAGRQDQVEDLVQDAFLRVFQALPRFTVAGPARLSTWILSIATRAVIDELRRPGPRKTPLEVVEDELAGGERPDVHSERRAMGRAIEAAVASLSPEVRAAFVLRAYHELDYAEIAQALEVGLGTVKSRLWRARAALQEHLQEVRQEARR
ncbi:RNA polymerase sigma factor [Paraliomyxa miuraensis]|uniref:RNA polymerase sigma factor n=1 Tax=Paraliomyxa miuraensis TaxID=376150 RepID=UPI00224D8B2C|nr:sigma-70 family RNA polymerase sigma factor [Paraliomyxa miuraensis]MCX4245762.1 sigma-70 family RNA polymerase sigma factor [Paraliomyxa miuraensis]